MSANDFGPFHVFRFFVEFSQVSIGKDDLGPAVNVCNGAFAECTGLEATMEAKAIKEGGRNYGNAQRAGGTTFSTVILKRGIGQPDLFHIFNSVAKGMFAPRLQVTITLFRPDGTGALAWQLDHAMPVKFKFADLNAKGSEVGIEELHLVHEGLWSTAPLPNLQGTKP